MVYAQKITAQVLILMVLALVAAFPAASDTTRLSVSEAHNRASSGEIILIDVRTPEEWKKTGVGASAQAVSMHLPGFFKKIEAIVKGDKSRVIALICATGRRSIRMQSLLQQRGYTNLIDVPEGMLGSAAGPGWLKSKLPVKNPQ